VAVLLTTGLLVAFVSAIQNEGPALFAEDHPLEMDLSVDLWALCRRPDQAGCEDVPAALVYRDHTEAERRLAIKVRSRGRWRLNPKNCSVPPMFLVFPAEETKGTLFEGQEVLPLTTHCRSRQRRYKHYVLREYLAYRLYGLFTDKSLRARLVRVRYLYPDGKMRLRPHYAFFTEHFSSLAQRSGTKLWDPEELDPAMVDPMVMATMELFQFMIGHVDWSALAQHNVVLLRAPAGEVTPVPFDFDFSGLVDAEYAGPPPGMPINRVTKRLYRGLCNPDLDWDLLFAKFEYRKDAVFALLDELPGLSGRARNRVRKFLGDFYGIIESPEQRQASIIDACRPVEYR
jgi:hypothetical protein